MAIPVNRAMLASQTAAANASKIDQFPSNIGPHGMLLVFKDYKFQNSTTRLLLNLPMTGPNVATDSNGAVLLPIPNTLNDNTSMDVVRYNMADVPFYETMAAGASWIKSFGAGEYQNYIPEKTNSPGWLDLLATLKKGFGDNFYLGAASQGIGATLNPKSSLIFKGIDLKEYSFEWTLAPTDAGESDALRKIIRKIKANTLPSYTTESVYTAAMLKYPSTVDIFLLGVDPNHYVKFKTAMVSDVAVNYTQNGLSILKGGRPASVSLTLRLKEMDIHTSNNYGGGSYGIDTGVIASQDGAPAADASTWVEPIL